MAACNLTDRVYIESSDEELLLPSLKVKVKVKVTLEQAMKAQRGSRGIALLFF
jgi:hypothetical protein